MLDYINNLNFEDSINTDEMFNLYKTKSSNINSLILSKFDCHSKLFDFFSKYTELDINSISKSIENINNQLSITLIPNSKFANDTLEQYINVLSTIILTIHYTNKIILIFSKKLKEFQQDLIKGMINNNLSDDYIDKIIEYNYLSNSTLKPISQNEICFSNFVGNKPKVFNHFGPNTQKYFNLEDPTPKFSAYQNEQKSPKKRNNNIIKENNKGYEKKKDEIKKQPSNRANKSPSSLISMSSILVNNKKQEERNSFKKRRSIKNQNIKKINQLTPEKKNMKIKREVLTKGRKFFSDKILKNHKDIHSKDKKLKTLYNENKDNKNNGSEEGEIQKNSCKVLYGKEINNSGNKELFVEFLKFTNDLYKEKYIDENQKKILKQLIIIYIASKHEKKK